ncbi:hypothetical protein GGTG_09886 [Gaeumannomyces tritici R3-111a-1]|uniref:Nephrocystin 3-like N-terminal domain-containing protein n=1 Tax=Gaeumannomyces tritici (strain R3-111a-1) TaxID=644352 RepID=J3P8Q1_GAET3|nr:hypothetical protein GGTG_09886 [Gaeumannomyces tritici R3-111a-1]EJT73035.1 hypothetical protein GGTG_09886 [Gaeumannomyces tritici R3-111a-1]
MHGRENTVKPAHDATCGWLSQHPDIVDWLNASDGNDFLWIMGNPGTGKSTVMKFVIDHVRTTHSTPENLQLLSFFFHNRGVEQEKIVLGLYRTFLYQIIKAKRRHPGLARLLKETQVDPTEVEGVQWTNPFLQRLLFNALNQLFSGDKLVCFVDALDECDSGQARGLVGTLQQARRLAAAAGVNLLICISSRHFPHISVERRYLLVLERIEDHYKDIISYLDTELNIGQGQEQETMRRELIRKSRGSFLWVVLVVASLNEAYDQGLMEALEARMKEIPDDVAKLFASLLNKSGPNQLDTYHCLLWVLCSREPLKVSELYVAILRSRKPPEDILVLKSNLPRIEDMSRFIINCARGLVEILPQDPSPDAFYDTPYDPILQFIHETVIDFLSSPNGLTRLDGLEAPEFQPFAHDKIASVCLKYLEDLLVHNPHLGACSSLESYSTRFLTSHAGRGASVGSFVENLDDRMVFVWLKKYFTWFSPGVGIVIKHLDETLPKEVILLYACQTPNRRWLEARWMVPQIVANLKNVDVVTHGLSPLTFALRWGTTGSMDDILEALGLLGPACSGALITKLVREYGENAGIPGERAVLSWVKWHPTLLSFFVAAGAADMVRQLIRSDKLDVNAKHYTGRTPLVFAIERGHDEIATLLLQTGRVDLRARFQGRTALMSAVSARRAGIVEQLLRHGQVLRDINVTSGQDDMATALLMAVGDGPFESSIVSLLLSVPGIDVNSSRVFSRSTPLHEAAKTGAVEVMEMLLARPDLDVNKPDSWGDTATMRAIRQPDRSRARLVLEALLRSPKVDFDRQDAVGCTLLGQAVAAGDVELVEVLLASGRCDANLPDRLGYTPYRTAELRGLRDIKRLFVDLVPDLDVDAREVWAAGCP